MGNLELNASSHAALLIKTSSAFTLFTGGGWKCQNAQGKVVFMTFPPWPDVPSRKNSPEKLFVLHFQPGFAKSHGTLHHLEQSVERRGTAQHVGCVARAFRD